jgi:hypothetical protein
VFVDSPGTATVSGDELLKAFDQERQTFIMDYDDPRLAFAGKVTAKVLSTAELRSALDAFNMFRGEISYPNGYESRLIGALRRGQNPDAYEVEVQIIP